MKARKSEPGKGLRSEPMVEARFQRLVEDTEKAEAGEEVIDPTKGKWQGNTLFLSMIEEVACTRYIKASLTEPKHIEQAETALNSNTLFGVEPKKALLDFYFQHAGGQKFANTMAGLAKSCIKNVLERGFDRFEYEILRYMFERYELATRTDFYEAGKSYANLVGAIAFETNQLVIQDEHRRADPNTRRERLACLYSMAFEWGGDLYNGYEYILYGKRQTCMSAFHEIWAAYDEEGVDVHALNAIIDAGADWESEYNLMPDGVQEQVDKHPRVMAERLGKIAGVGPSVRSWKPKF